MELITTHSNAEFDSFASMVAARRLYPEAVLVFPGAQERNVRLFLEAHPQPYRFRRLRGIRLEQVTRLILVDTRRRDRIGRLAELVGRPGVEVHVYDHHPPSPQDIRGDHEVIAEVGAAATLMTELLRERHLRITPAEATMLGLGIYEDTGSMTFVSTTPRDIRAAAFLLECGMDLQLIADYVTHELTAEQVSLLDELLGTCRRVEVGGIAVGVATASRDRFVGDLALLGHKVKDIQNLNVLFLLVRMHDRIHLVARSRIEAVDAGRVAAAFGGGGHASAASAVIRETDLEAVTGRLMEVLETVVRPLPTARELMDAAVRTVPAGTTLQEAWTLMTRFGLDVLPVTGDGGRLLGLVDRRLAERAVGHGLGGQSVDGSMATDVETVGPGEPLARIEELSAAARPGFPAGAGGGEAGGRDRPGQPAGRPPGGGAGAPGAGGAPRRCAGPAQPVGPGRRAPAAGCGRVDPEDRRHRRGGRDQRLPGGRLRARPDPGRAQPRPRRGRRGGRHRLRRPAGQGTGRKGAEPLALRDGGGHPARRFQDRRGHLAHGVLRAPRGAAGGRARADPDGPLAARLHHQRDGGAPLGGEFGRLIDPGGGQRDLADGIIRVLHGLSFVEDPTRLYRAVRFEQRLDFAMSEETLRLVRAAVASNQVDTIVGPRLLGELEEILKEARPEAALRRLGELDLLRAIHPSLSWTRIDPGLHSRLREEERARRDGGKPPVAWWILHLAALVRTFSLEEIESLRSRLGMAEPQGKLLGDVWLGHRRLLSLAVDTLRPSEVRRELLAQPPEALVLAAALAPDSPLAARVREFLAGERLPPLLTGADLTALGYQPGPSFKAILGELEDARVNGQVSDRDAAIAWLRRHHPCP